MTVSAAESRTVFRRVKGVLLAVLTVGLAALYAFPQEGVLSALLRAPPVAARSGVPPLPPPHRAAVVYAGRVGRHADMTEARASWASLRRHLVAPNPAWAVDVFFHTWDRHLTRDLVELLAPVAYGNEPTVVNGMAYDGKSWFTGPASSAEIALMLLVNHTTARGAPYDRIIVTRYDAVLLAPFSLAALADDDAFYASNWCLATGPPLSVHTGWLACHALDRVRYDHNGLPDFWFGGSQSVMLRFYTNFTQQVRAADWPGAGAPKLHGIYRKRLMDWQAKSSIVLRHYMYHFLDVELYRFTAACGGWDAPPGNRSYFDRGDSSHSPTQESECGGGRYMCARDESSYYGCNVYNPNYR